MLERVQRALHQAEKETQELKRVVQMQSLALAIKSAYIARLRTQVKCPREGATNRNVCVSQTSEIDNLEDDALGGAEGQIELPKVLSLTDKDLIQKA